MHIRRQDLPDLRVLARDVIFLLALSATNKVVPLFIQDNVAEFLPKEIPLGNAVTFYAILMFITPDKVGLLINEFSKGDVGKQFRLIGTASRTVGRRAHDRFPTDGTASRIEKCGCCI